MLAEDRVIDDEVAGVGAGFGSVFFKTAELRVIKYKEAMQVECKGWRKAVHDYTIA